MSHFFGGIVCMHVKGGRSLRICISPLILVRYSFISPCFYIIPKISIPFVVLEKIAACQGNCPSLAFDPPTILLWDCGKFLLPAWQFLEFWAELEEKKLTTSNSKSHFITEELYKVSIEEFSVYWLIDILIVFIVHFKSIRITR